MDEMQLIRELGNATPLPTKAELASARARLLAAKPRRGKRFAVYGGAVIGMAAAIFAAVTLVTPEENNTANADPVLVLQYASAAALGLPDTAPRPDQFLYTRTQRKDGSVREDWHSIDGTHDGLFLIPDHTTRKIEAIPVPGCRDGKAAVIKGDKPLPGKSKPCEPSPAYLPDLPKDADGMLEYLRKSNGKSTNSIAKDISSLLQFKYLTPQSRAALFGVVSKIDGLRAVPGAKDVAGRPGIQIEWNSDGYQGDFIVDAKTYAYLGDARYSALLGYAIVDKVQQRP